MPFISQFHRQSDYNYFSSTTPIVIDNGASYFRIGWAGETDPRVIFRNIVQRPRHKATGETVTIVGDHDPALLKYFDCTRSGPRSAFDSNVVYQFEIMEYILDFGFDRLGANGSQIDHPILITECVCNPVQSRCKMAELLFETYGVPSVAFGVDAAFSYKYNQRHGICDKDGLAICPGFTTTHVIPFIDGEPVYKGCCRTNIGGFHVTDYLKQLLSLKYPHHMARFTWEKVEDLKMEHCYIAPDYTSEARLFQKGTKEAEDKTRCWQLPWVPPPVEEPPSEEEIARKAAIKETRENPELYLEQMRVKYKELSEKVEQRKRLKANGNHSNGNNVPGGVGRGERLNAAQRERMRLLTTAAFDRGREIDPAFVPKLDVGPSQPAPEIPRFRPLTKEDFQILLGVERFRCPEILFHPNLVGIDQAGLDEMAGVSIRRLSTKDQTWRRD
ncbi:hypothetical protein GH714_010892 [Hevea brasiliensis]|uniref:Actin-related protein 5 n=1 Tax=Hevea brasiliensis TaxID=3981 RepID=A0A6A6MXZ1_HEVBR|nr:hypothetical protein GH714_010892 [Hevea brasiliensis]